MRPKCRSSRFWAVASTVSASCAAPGSSCRNVFARSATIRKRSNPPTRVSPEIRLRQRAAQRAPREARRRPTVRKRTQWNRRGVPEGIRARRVTSCSKSPTRRARIVNRSPDKAVSQASPGTPGRKWTNLQCQGLRAQPTRTLKPVPPQEAPSLQRTVAGELLLERILKPLLPRLRQQAHPASVVRRKLSTRRAPHRLRPGVQYVPAGKTKLTREMQLRRRPVPATSASLVRSVATLSNSRGTPAMGVSRERADLPLRLRRYFQTEPIEQSRAQRGGCSRSA